MNLDTQTLNSLVEQLRRFVNERLIPMESQTAEQDEIPSEIIREMQELGLFGVSVPEEFGGLGLNMEEEVFIMLELGRASPAFRSLFATNVGIGSQGIVIDGTIEQKKRFLPRIASGEIIASFALTEPDVGSDAASIKTSAVKDGQEYVLSGTKRYITNAPIAGLFTVMARTGERESGAGGVSAFIVDAGTPGLSVGAPERKMGQHGTKVADVIFDGCRIPEDRLLGGVEGIGFRTAMKVLDRGRLGISAACVGFASRILDESSRYACERIQFGKAIREFQLIQAMLADSLSELSACRALTLETARRKDKGEDVGTAASICKLMASEMVGRIADRNVQIHGGAGYITDYPAERHYRDARLYRIYEGTSEIQRLKIARDHLKSYY